jgi:hypothetical protein
MTQAVARRELAGAREKGFCGFCLAKAEPGKLLSTMHNEGCVGVRDAGLKRRGSRR